MSRDISYTVSTRDPHADFQFHRDGTISYAHDGKNVCRFTPTNAQAEKLFGKGGTIHIRGYQIVRPHLRLVKSNPIGFVQKHPWMTFFLGLAAVSAVVTIVRGYKPATTPNNTGTGSSLPINHGKITQLPPGVRVTRRDHPRLYEGEMCEYTCWEDIERQTSNCGMLCQSGPIEPGSPGDVGGVAVKQ